MANPATQLPHWKVTIAKLAADCGSFPAVDGATPRGISSPAASFLAAGRTYSKTKALVVANYSLLKIVSLEAFKNVSVSGGRC